MTPTEKQRLREQDPARLSERLDALAADFVEATELATHYKAAAEHEANAAKLLRIERGQLQAECERLRHVATGIENQRHDTALMRDALLGRVDTLTARLASVEKLCEEAVRVGEGMIDLVAPGLDTFRDLAITDLAEIRATLAKKETP